jgi:hypothetical protein
VVCPLKVKTALNLKIPNNLPRKTMNGLRCLIGSLPQIKTILTRKQMKFLSQPLDARYQRAVRLSGATAHHLGEGRGMGIEGRKW